MFWVFFGKECVKKGLPKWQETKERGCIRERKIYEYMALWRHLLACWNYGQICFKSSNETINWLQILKYIYINTSKYETKPLDLLSSEI